MIYNHIIDVKMLEKDNKLIRAAMLKIRYADLIFKAQQQISGKAIGKKEMKKKAKLWEAQLQKEKVKSHREKAREEARTVTANIKKTVEFGDSIQVENDFLAMIGATNH
ncbi:hypothetical protein H5410_032628 [Solanum commersonii]|uniref:Uncharacterized protein n=1 Tax=Solanum commersonii TaxID=4109 RepID=A0A9J5YLG7_SOLCO|nr:hypothetical protein H5410_032628 [Solanum commersonii]